MNKAVIIAIASIAVVSVAVVSFGIPSEASEASLDGDHPHGPGQGGVSNCVRDCTLTGTSHAQCQINCGQT